MHDFAPDAPNVWSGIEQGVQVNAAVQGGAASGKVVLSKVALTVIKVATIIAIPVSVTTYFFTKNNDAERTTPIEKNDGIRESKVIDAPAIVLEKTSTQNLLIQKTTKYKKTANSVKNNIAKIAEVSIKSNYNETVVTKDYENLKHQNLEKIFVPQVNNSSVSNSNQDEVDLTDKIDSIENTENSVEATDVNKNESFFVKIPNVLTPNNDGLNDKYVVEMEGEKWFNLKIYNFNNELIFESNDKNYTWDGVSLKTGQPCNSGVYYGVLSYKTQGSEKFQTKMTKIKLIR